MVGATEELRRWLKTGQLKKLTILTGWPVRRPKGRLDPFEQAVKQDIELEVSRWARWRNATARRGRRAAVLSSHR